jgi:hypothetical protein
MSEQAQHKYYGIAIWLVQQVPDSVSVYLRGSSALPKGQIFPPWDIDVVLVTGSLPHPLNTAAKLAARATHACGTDAPVDIFVVRQEDLLRSERQVHSRVLLQHESFLLWGRDVLREVPRHALNATTAKLIAPEVIRTAEVKHAQFVSRMATNDIDDREFEGRSKSLAKAGLRLACIESLAQHGRFVRSPAECMQVWQLSEHPGVVKDSAAVAYQAIGGIRRTDAVLLCEAIEQMRLYVQRYAGS